MTIRRLTDIEQRDLRRILEKLFLEAKVDIGVQALLVEMWDEISVIQNAAADLQADILAIQASIATLQGDTSSLQSDVAALQGDVSNLQANVSAMLLDISGAQNDITALQGSVAGVQGDIGSLQSLVSGLQGDVAALQADVSTLMGRTAGLAGGAVGDLLFHDGIGWTPLAAGALGQSLSARGAAAPEWQSPTSSQVVGSTSAPTTTSSTFSTLAQMTQTLSLKAGAYLVWFSGTFSSQNGDFLEVRLAQDGSPIPGTTHSLGFTGAGGLLGLTPGTINAVPIFLLSVVILPADASVTVSVQWRATSGTARAVTTQRALTVARI